MVCSSFCMNLMEFSATAISRASSVEIGTVSTHSKTVFIKLFVKLLRPMTLWKLPIPILNVFPPMTARPL